MCGLAFLLTYDFIILQSCSNAGPVGIAPKKIKMFVSTEF